MLKMMNVLAKQINNAFSQLQAGNTASALSSFQAVLKKEPGNAAALLGLGMTLNRSGNPSDALVALKRVWLGVHDLKDDVKSGTRAEVMAQVGLAFQQLGQADNALKAFKIAQELQDSPQLRQLIALHSAPAVAGGLEKLITQARGFAAMNRIADAISTYKVALQLKPDNDEVLHGLGDALRISGDFAGALTCVQQAIVMQPQAAAYQNTLGMIYLQQGELEKSLKALQRALRLDARYAMAYCNIGVALKRLGRVQDAAKAYQTAISLEPNMPEAHNNLGNLLSGLGQVAQAKACFTRALALRPNYPDAKRNLLALQGQAPTAKSAPATGPKRGATSSSAKQKAKATTKATTKAKSKSNATPRGK